MGYKLKTLDEARAMDSWATQNNIAQMQARVIASDIVALHNVRMRKTGYPPLNATEMMPMYKSAYIHIWCDRMGVSMLSALVIPIPAPLDREIS